MNDTKRPNRTDDSDTIIYNVITKRSNGGFMTSLTDALIAADLENRDRIAKGFPELVDSYMSAWNDLGHAAFIEEYEARQHEGRSSVITRTK